MFIPRAPTRTQDPAKNRDAPLVAVFCFSAAFHFRTFSLRLTVLHAVAAGVIVSSLKDNNLLLN